MSKSHAYRVPFPISQGGEFRPKYDLVLHADGRHCEAVLDPPCLRFEALVDRMTQPANLSREAVNPCAQRLSKAQRMAESREKGVEARVRSGF